MSTVGIGYLVVGLLVHFCLDEDKIAVRDTVTMPKDSKNTSINVKKKVGSAMVVPKGNRALEKHN